jgi:hypothetical protein
MHISVLKFEINFNTCHNYGLLDVSNSFIISSSIGFTAQRGHAKLHFTLDVTTCCPVVVATSALLFLMKIFL